MPHPKANAKKTGDTHLPEVEFDLQARAGASAVAAAGGPPSGRLSRGVQKAGGLKTADEEPSNETADSGDSEQAGRGR